MKLLFLLISILLFNVLNAQYYVAGFTNINDYFYDINPDSTIFGPVYAPPQEFLLDIDNNGFDDFIFEAYNSGGNGGAFRYIKITSLDNNEIAISGPDSCFGNPAYYPIPPHYVKSFLLAHSFNYNDTINTIENWKDTSAFVSYYNFIGGEFDCGGGNFSNSSQYIGVRVFDSADTIYGWVKVKSLNSSSIVFEEYSCNKQTANNISEINNLIFTLILYQTKL